MKNTLITNEKQLRKLIPAYNKILDKRIQNSLDQISFEFIEKSKFAAIFHDNSIDYIPWNIKSIKVHSPNELSIESNFRSARDEEIATATSLYLFIPGINHGLRINGLSQFKDNRLYIFIHTLYFQCARAATRAKLWEKRMDSNTTPESIEGMIQYSRYALLATQNNQGETELSPRGEGDQCVHLLNTHQVLLAERPGNKVAISLRNILQNPKIVLSLINSRGHQSLQISGQAEIRTDSNYLNSLTVDNKQPTLAILINIDHMTLKEEPALGNPEIWNIQSTLDSRTVTPFSKAINQHMNGQGLFSKVTAPIIDSIIQSDLKQLY